MMKNPDDDLTDLPWSIEVDMLRRIHRLSIDVAIDFVCIRYLRNGDTRALAWFLREGHLPLDKLCTYLSGMLAPGDIPGNRLPFELRAVSRDGRRGRRSSPEKELRDWLIYKQVIKQIEVLGAGSYEAAISDIAALKGLNRPTVKRAYETIAKALSDHAPKD